MSALAVVPSIIPSTISSEQWHQHMDDMFSTVRDGLVQGSKVRFGEITFVFGLLGDPVSIETPSGVRWSQPPQIPNFQPTQGREDQIIRTPPDRSLLLTTLRRFQYGRETDWLIIENKYEAVYFWKAGSGIGYTYASSPIHQN